MGVLTLTSGEYDNIRLLMGAETTEADLTDDQITHAILGQASSYVFLRVTKDVDVGYVRDNLNTPMDLSRLPAGPTTEDRLKLYGDEYYASVTILRSIDVNWFIEDAMTSSQREAFRRAVVYRAAGLAMSVLKPQVLVEDADAGVSVRRSDKGWSEVQAGLFAGAEEAIDLVLELYPNDAFPSESYSVFTVI